MLVVVIQVEVQNRGGQFSVPTEGQLFHRNIEDLRDRTKQRSYQTEKLISQLKEEGIEILNSRLEKATVIVWIWCHSQTATEYIHKLYESIRLTEVLSRLANIRKITSEIINWKMINIDSNEFKETVGKLL